MPTRITQDELMAQSLKTVRQLRNSLLYNAATGAGSILILYLFFTQVELDLTADMSILTVRSLPGYFVVVLCILAFTGALGTVLYGYRLRSYLRELKV
jgi:ABC-type uncharacterized transport system fused permease/ATPase subunit